MAPIDTFDDPVFAAFEPRKWSSNLFNMERMKVRDLLVSLGQAVEPSLAALRPFHRDVTPHMPCVFNGRRVSEMVLYFTRTAEEQRAILPLLDSRISLPDQISDAGEHHRHVCLGLRVHEFGVEAGLLMQSTAWLDVMNLLNRCRSPMEASQVLGRIRDLPAGCEIRLTPRDTIPAASIATVHFRKLEEAVLNETFLIRMGRYLDRTDPILRAAGFASLLRDLFVALVPVFDFVAWRPASDYLRVATEAKRTAVAVESGVADLAVGSRIQVTSGPFAGRDGVVTELDHKGVLRILIGKVTVRTDGRSVRLIA